MLGGLVKSKLAPDYWRTRLFRNCFTANGKRFRVNHWSVKIQHRGTRKTFSLNPADRAEAAKEACRIYQQIITEGWEGLSQSRLPEISSGSAMVTAENLSRVEYWSKRLIHRKYTEKFHPKLERELAARVYHAGTSYYFPLQTDNRKQAAARAARIYETVVRRGWEKAIQRYPRELSIAIHWVENPVAWTYTTIQTQPKESEGLYAPSAPFAGETLNIAISEPDSGIHKALAWCIDQQEGCHTAARFRTAAETLNQLPRSRVHLLLVSQNLVDQHGAPFLNSLKRLAPNVVRLIFSTYEDCDLLFARAPGGATSYLFRRTQPTRLLEPIAEVNRGAFTQDALAAKVRSYFEKAVATLPVGSGNQSLSNLTQRELEILGLLSKGQSDKEIADLLRISTWTVHGHLKKIFEKLGAHNRTEAVLKYLHK